MPSTINLPFGTGTGGVGSSRISLAAAINLRADLADVLNFSLFNANSPCTPQRLNLISGANTIDVTACPALPQSGGVFLVPPAGNIVTLTLKGVTGDTGIALSLTVPTFLPFTSTPPTSFVITTSNTVSGFLLLWI